MTSPKLLYILFRNPNGGNKKAHAAALERARQIAQWPGLLRKTWIYDAATQEYGGIYLFQDSDSLQAYLDGPVVSSIKAIPGLEDWQTRIFDVETFLTEITGGLSQL